MNQTFIFWSFDAERCEIYARTVRVESCMSPPDMLHAKADRRSEAVKSEAEAKALVDEWAREWPARSFRASTQAEAAQSIRGCEPWVMDVVAFAFSERETATFNHVISESTDQA